MRYAIISDIHSNYEALKTVLEYLQKNPVDKIICLGDIVGYGPQPKECIGTVRGVKNLSSVIGNHDAAVSGKMDTSSFSLNAQAALQINSSMLDDEEKKYLSSLKMSIKDGISVFVHGSPRDPLHEYLYLTEKMKANIKYFRGDICFVGHTHQPIIYEYFNSKNESFYDVKKDVEVFNLETEAKYIVNVGSVGQPRDNNPAACMVFFDTKHLAVTYRRIPYDVEKTQDLMNERGLPRQLSARLSLGV